MLKNFLFVIIYIFLFSSCKIMTSTDMFQTNPDFAFDPVNPKVKQITIAPGDQLAISMTTNNGISLFEPRVDVNNSTVNSSGATASIGNTNGISTNNLGTFGYYIESDSTVKLPAVGRIKLGGLTLRKTETYLEELLSDNYQKPFVKVKITNRKVTVFYELATHATIIPITEENFTIVDILAKMGGVPEYSKAYNIKIVRGDRINPKVFNFSVRSLSDFKNNNILLEANDIVYIASRPRYITKTVSELQPYFLLITTSILFYSFYHQYIK